MAPAEKTSVNCCIRRWFFNLFTCTSKYSVKRYSLVARRFLEHRRLFSRLVLAGLCRITSRDAQRSWHICICEGRKKGGRTCPSVSFCGARYLWVQSLSFFLFLFFVVKAFEKAMKRFGLYSSSTVVFFRVTVFFLACVGLLG